MLDTASASSAVTRQITFAPTFTGWQKAARRALCAGLRPDQLMWEELGAEQPGLGIFEEGELAADAGKEATPFRVPRAFVEIAQRAACHRDPRRWALLYRVLWRLTHGEPKLLEVPVDDDVHTLAAMDKAVRHEVHKMRAFVRFREVRADDGSWYVAWFEPSHPIIEMNAPFFVDRFAGMRWSILTPDRCMHWDGEHLSYTPGVPKSEAPDSDAMENLWRTYYGHIFNPARVKVKAMQAEMPKRYWKNLPEATLIPAMLNEAPARVDAMVEASRRKVAQDEDDYSIAEPPDTASWNKLREAAKVCKACPLWRNATQTVFGEGDHPAKVMLLGEQPGDAEDLAGKPFVGPAGKLLDKALEEAGVDRATVYVTNVVKHFKWEPRGKRRLHKKPSGRDIAACRPWFEAEMRAVKPQILVCLGATAAQAIFGSGVRILRDRGEFRESEYAAHTLITYHPSALLRAPDEETRERQYAEFVADLKKVARKLD